jgi:hypothetical protein
MDTYFNRWFNKKELAFRQALLKRFPSKNIYVACFNNIDEIETKYIDAECVQTEFSMLYKRKDAKGVLYCDIIDDFLKKYRHGNTRVIYDISKHITVDAGQFDTGNLRESCRILAIARHHKHSNIFDGTPNPKYWNQVDFESMESLKSQGQRYI